MGGDSAGTSDWSILARNDPKVFVRQGFIYGFSGSFRMGDLLKYRFNPTVLGASAANVVKYMCTSYVDELRACFEQYAFGKTEEGEQSGGEFVVGFRGRLFQIFNDFQVAIPSIPFCATGCAKDIALGAMRASGGLNARIRIRHALEASYEFNGSVRPPWVIKSIRIK